MALVRVTRFHENRRMPRELSVVALDLGVEAGDLLPKLRGVGGGESRIERRQDLPLGDAHALPDVDALDDGLIERLIHLRRTRQLDFAPHAGDDAIDLADPEQQAGDEHERRQGLHRDLGRPRLGRLPDRGDVRLEAADDGLAGGFS